MQIGIQLFMLDGAVFSRCWHPCFMNETFPCKSPVAGIGSSYWEVLVYVLTSMVLIIKALINTTTRQATSSWKIWHSTVWHICAILQEVQMKILIEITIHLMNVHMYWFLYLANEKRWLELFLWLSYVCAHSINLRHLSVPLGATGDRGCSKWNAMRKLKK